MRTFKLIILSSIENNLNVKKINNEAPLIRGQIVIIIPGWFRGRHLVYLKKIGIESLFSHWTFKYDGVPLKKIDAAYVLTTNIKSNDDVNIAVKKALNEITMIKECLRNRFALKNKDKLHLMKF